jgi:hypothetical protein
VHLQGLPGTQHYKNEPKPREISPKLILDDCSTTAAGELAVVLAALLESAGALRTSEYVLVAFSESITNFILLNWFVVAFRVVAVNTAMVFERFNV